MRFWRREIEVIGFGLPLYVLLALALVVMAKEVIL